MTFSDTPGALKKFRRTPWKFQQTYLTPLKHLHGFVAAIMSVNQEMKSACFTIEQAVFEPTHLIAVLADHSIPPRYERGVSIRATDQKETQLLLHAILSDSVDFIFVPEPKTFAVYADHDEYTTFFAHTRSRLDRVVHALSGEFKMVPDYERHL
jgi:hypothetical protein